MGKYVYFLSHIYEYGEEKEHEAVKHIGVSLQMLKPKKQ